MIVLKILLWILLAVLGLVILVCALPVGADFSYTDGKLKYKVKLSLINVMDSGGGGVIGWLKRRKEKKQKKRSQASDTPPFDPASIDLAELYDIPEPEITPEEGIVAPGAADMPVIAVETPPTEESSGGKKEKKKKKHKKKDEELLADEVFPDDTDEDSKPDDGIEKSLTDKLEFLIDVWNSAKRPIHKIFRGFKFKDFYIDFIIANEDAYKCALSYGRLSTAIFRILAQMSRLFTIRFKTVDVQPGFGLNKGRWDAAFKVRFRLGTAVIAGIWFLITYIFRIFIPGKLKKRKAKKTAVVQK